MQEAIAKENVTQLHPWSDEELIEWADKEIVSPFRNICEVARELVHGGTVSKQRATVRLPLMPHKLDWRGIHKFLRDAMPVIMFEPANFISIVLANDGKKILKAHRCTTTYNNFTDLEELKVEGEEWGELALNLLAEGKEDFLRAELDEHMRANGEPDVNMVIVSNINAIETFRRELGDDLQKARDKYTSTIFNAFRKVFKREWLNFYPFPRTISRIKELTEIIEVASGKAGSIHDGKSAPLKMGFVFEGRDYRFGLKWDSEDPHDLSIDQDLIDRDIPLKKQARIIRKKVKANNVITMSADMFLNLLHEFVNRPYPQSDTDLKIMLKKILYTISGYGKIWDIYPAPIPLKKYVRYPIKILGLPYDINNLSWGSLPKLIVDGGKIGIGQMTRYSYVSMDKDKIQGITLIDIYKGGVSKIKTLDPSDYQDILEGTKLRLSSVRKRLIDVKQRIWEREGWVDIIILSQRDLNVEMRRLMSNGAFNSMLRTPLAIGPSMKMGKILKKGGFLVYPSDNFSKYAEPWLAKTGPMKLLGNAIQIPFDRKKPRSRGVLYIKETIIAAGVAAGVIALLIQLIF